jgi:hypothetical protein
VEDDVKDCWIHRNNPKSIQEIDACCSNARQETAFEMIANRWNETNFNPTTMISNCHNNFMEEIDIGFDATANFTRASSTKVKDKLAKMKSDLTCIIQKWERSGQEDSGTMEEDDNDKEDSAAEPREKFDWGQSKGQIVAFDCRESFLGPMS